MKNTEKNMCNISCIIYSLSLDAGLLGTGHKSYYEKLVTYRNERV